MLLEESSLRIIVMGVSGSGKSTLAQNLSQILQLRMKDGDELHLPESVTKMSAGIALDDEDRWPWLDRIAQYLIDADTENGPGGIVACSALKRIYRDRIRQQAGPVVFLFLEGPPDLIRQLQTLEKPTAEESDVITLSIDQPIDQIVRQALKSLKTTSINALS
jgi:gluconate kinase